MAEAEIDTFCYVYKHEIWYVTDLRRFNYNQIKMEKRWIVSLEFLSYMAERTEGGVL